MRKIVAFLFILSSYSIPLSAQSFEIPAGTQPFYEIIEWKGVGAIVLSRDPSFQQQQVVMTMVNSEEKSIWEDNFNPMSKEIHYIAEEKGKYAYFLEGLQPKDGKIYLHQLTAVGNIKSTNWQFNSALKRLGNFRAEDMEVVDIVTTEKALVCLMRYEDKAKNMIQTISVSMTHHNFTSYACIVAENNSASSKTEDQVSWYLAGENGDNIIFAARANSGKASSWKVKEMDPKGKMVRDFSISSNGTKFSDHQRVGFGRRGSALLKKVEPMEKGTLVFYNNRYIVGGIEVENNQGKLVSYEWKDDKWMLIASSNIGTFTAKKSIQVGYFQLKSGIAWYVKNSESESHYHSFEGKTVVNKTSDQATSNASRCINDIKPGMFLCELETKWLVFDKKQLGKKAALTFEFIVK